MFATKSNPTGMESFTVVDVMDSTEPENIYIYIDVIQSSETCTVVFFFFFIEDKSTQMIPIGSFQLEGDIKPVGHLFLHLLCSSAIESSANREN